jgi:non-specific serine/threonine protein kinase
MLRASHDYPHNIPAPLTSFVGRERELALTRHLLREYRLVTLTGVGGCGKTRLALHAAADEVARFPAGVWFVDLTPLIRADADAVAGMVAQVLGDAIEPGSDMVDALGAILQSRQTLLILDNCEHVVSACATLVSALLARCAGLEVLATSREPLAVDGEVVAPVPPLALPDSLHTADLDDFMRSDAIRLFVERARAADATFQLDDRSSQAVGAICRRLDGLPLALELAAVRIRTMPVRLLADRLGDHLELLVHRDRSAPSRQQTLHALIDWSYSLLEERERVVFRRLASFSGGFTPAAAEVVCADDQANALVAPALPQAEALNILLRLVDKSLVQIDRLADRYRLLETIRSYALEKLDESGEAASIGVRHLEWYLRFAESGSDHVGGPGEREWLDTLDGEHANCLAALSWAVQEGRAEEAARLALALWPLWHARTNLTEGRRWFEQIAALEDRRPVSPVIRARLLNVGGVIEHTLGQFDRADELHTAAIALSRQLGDEAGLAMALLDQGWQYFYQANEPGARARAEESLALARRIANPCACAAALFLRAGIASLQQQAQTDISDLEECLRIWRELGDAGSVASASTVLAMAEIAAANYDRAKALLADAFLYHTQVGNLVSLGSSFTGLMQVAIHAKDQLQGAQRATRMLGAAMVWAEGLGGKTTQLARETADLIMAPAQAILGEAAFAQELEAGRRLTRDEVVELALTITRPDPEPPGRHPAIREGTYPNDLTAREVEVLRLVASGLTNPQIGQQLVLSPRTIEAHLRSIFAKLNVTTRAAATRVAVELGLA